MISSASTLFLATLVLTTSVFSAPIRLPVATSEVVARAEVVPQLVAKAAVVDVQPLHRRSGLGIFSRRSARLTEREPLPETPEVPAARDILEEPEIHRRYPRRVYQEYYEKREPQPEPVDVPAPVVQKREERPHVYPRRVYYEYYEKRAPSPEPATKAKETTTMTTTNVSAFDSPEDLAAGNVNPGGSVGTTESSAISQAPTQAIPTSGSAATTTATASASSSASLSVATVTGSASSVTATGSATSTANAPAVIVTGSAIPIAEAGTPSAVVSGTSSSTAPAATDTSNPCNTTGRDNTQPSDDDPARPSASGGTSPFAPVGRNVQGTTTGSLIRRSAYSAAPGHPLSGDKVINV